MATNTKMLELTFNVEGGRSMILSIPSPTITPCGTTVNENGFLLSLGWRRRHSSFPPWALKPALQTVLVSFIEPHFI